MDLTSKQRAQLRSMANDLDTIVHIGKDGIGPNLTRQAEDALEARELIKGRVLENSPLSPGGSGGAGKGHPEPGGPSHWDKIRALPGDPQQAKRQTNQAGKIKIFPHPPPARGGYGKTKRAKSSW